MRQGERHVNHHRLEVMSGIMRGEAARSLQLLSAIDGAVEALIYTRRNMEALSETCESLIRRATTENMDGEPLTDEVIPSLVQVQGSAKMALEIMQARCRQAQITPNIEADDGVVEAYEQTIASIAGLIARVEILMSKVNERIVQMKMTPLERKLARQRPSFLARDVLDKVVKEHTAYYRAKANENDPQP